MKGSIMAWLYAARLLIGNALSDPEISAHMDSKKVPLQDLRAGQSKLERLQALTDQRAERRAWPGAPAKTSAC